jgi:hypothetical protein
VRALSLLIVFLLAKAAVLWGHRLPLSGWAPLAYIWQDVVVVLVYAAGAAWRERRGNGAKPFRLHWIYWALAGYAAINIPVGRAVFSPLTWPMLRAARGPLADSMLLYVTVTNCVLVAALAGAAFYLPRLLRHRGPRWYWAAAIPMVALGPAASARVDTHGMDRNPVAVLVEGAIPAGRQGNGRVWRTSIFPGARAENLTQFSGIAKGRNVVVVSLESTAAQYLGLYGSAFDTMPNLGALARNGLVFDNAYAVYPESIKGLYSVLCSVYPGFQTEAERYENSGCPAVSRVLNDAGYRTAMFHSGRFAYLGMESIIRNRGFELLEDAGEIGGNHNSSFGVDEPAAVTRILQWIDGRPRGQKFFVTYLPIAGHHPYPTPAPGPFAIHAEIDQYRNALHYGDESIGALMQGLRDRGLDRDTVWMIYGDHGEAFRQHDGNYGHTFFVYDENVRVPLVIAAPGLMGQQVRAHQVVSLVDVAPTLLDFLGMAVPPSYQGHSALDGQPRMALFFTDYSLGILGLRDGRWKFLYEMETHQRKLFDLDRDPGELVNLSAKEVRRSEWYSSVVRGWMGK